MLRTMSAFALVTAVLSLPLVAAAEGEATSRLAAMEQRLLALEDQLTQSNSVIQAQREMLQTQPVSQGSSLDKFLNGLEIGSYFYRHAETKRPFFAHVKTPSGVEDEIIERLRAFGYVE